MNKRILEIVETKLGINSNDYSMESSFTHDLGCDSLDFIDVIMECEREFNIVIPDDAAENIHTVQDLVDYITEHVK